MRVLCVLFALASCGAMAQVTQNTILNDTVDLKKLTKRPNPYYRTAQASSYDRATKTPGNEAWFANGDYGQYIRVEEREGRKERVMADLTGPGAVVRVWSANPAGTLRFYFDGEETPRLMAKTGDLLGGKVPPFGSPFAYTAARGWNFYYPLPYAKSLKVTVDDTDNDGAAHMYYHVGYRTYDAGTQVETFRMEDVDASAVDHAGKLLNDPYNPGYLPDFKTIRLNPDGVGTVKLPPGPKAVTYLYVKLSKAKLPKGGGSFGDPNQFYNQLRQIILEADFDGETCIRVPLGDFFGAAPGITPYVTFPMQTDSQGGMACRFVMPYAKSGEIRFRNMGKARAEVMVANEVFPYEWDANSYHFKAQWTGERGRTRPMRDMNFLKVAGEGIFVGDNLHISNPNPAWWGEGDEKIYVDGDVFPSTIGTGTEDYYGYAWSSNIAFMKPFHAQPHTEAPGNFGHSLVERFHVMDPMPFTRDFRFDMEMWHWQDVLATYVHTAYWYAKPGGTGPAGIDPRLLVIQELKPPEPVKDAIEGETLTIASISGGVADNQTGFFETSGSGQLWWRTGKPGDKLDLLVPVRKAGRYRITGHFCFARDYGIQKISVNGKEGRTIDFYSPNLEWRMVDLGVFDLTEGANHLVVEIAGTNDAANPKSYMFGLDYLKLGKG